MLVFGGELLILLKRRNEVYALRESESHRLLARGDDLMEAAWDTMLLICV